MEMTMGIGKAVAIFMNIESDKYTPDEKAEAIYNVLEMPTHNGITEDQILKATRYLFNRLYRVRRVEETKE